MSISKVDGFSKKLSAGDVRATGQIASLANVACPNGQGGPLSINIEQVQSSLLDVVSARTLSDLREKMD